MDQDIALFIAVYKGVNGALRGYPAVRYPERIDGAGAVVGGCGAAADLYAGHPYTHDFVCGASQHEFRRIQHPNGIKGFPGPGPKSIGVPLPLING